MIFGKVFATEATSVLMLLLVAFGSIICYTNAQYYDNILQRLPLHFESILPSTIFTQYYPRIVQAKAQVQAPQHFHATLLPPSSSSSSSLPSTLTPSSLSSSASSAASTSYLIWPQLSNANDFHSLEPEVEFVPLDAQRHELNHKNTESNRENVNEKPFEVDVITSDVNGNSHNPASLFQNIFPLFDTSILQGVGGVGGGIGNVGGVDNFGGFGSFGSFGIGTQREPWWKGPNVCIDKQEEEEVMDKGNTQTDISKTDDDVGTNLHEKNYHHLTFNSCEEKPNKYICKRVNYTNGKKKTLIETRQCCHGYGRSYNAAYSAPCEKIEIRDIETTAAAMGAKEFISKAKSSGLSNMLTSTLNITMFLPVDEEFNKFSDLLQSESNTVQAQTDDAMKELFRRHIVDGEINLHDVRNEQVLKTHADGQKIRINKYHMPLALNADPVHYAANCIPIVKHDKLSEQGMVHTLDGVLQPVNENLMELIRKRDDLSIMRTVLETTKLSKMLEGETPMTIFVPTDSAFEKVDPHLRRALKEGKGCASNILKNHMLDLTLCSMVAVPGTKATAYNLLGEALRFNRSKSSDDSVLPVVINDMATIMEADIVGTNGVMHVIDTIMPTKSAMPMSLLMEEKNITIFKNLLQLADLENEIDDLKNVTIFAPTNKAMEGTKWAELLDEKDDNLQDKTELVEFLKYHIAKPMTKTCELKEQLMPTLSGDNVRINLYSTQALFSNVMNRATANCARLVHFDDVSCGTVLHQVDKPLQPPKMNMLELLESNPNYSTFAKLIKKANLTDLLTDASTSYTVFAPKNEVFEELDDIKKMEEADLERMIKTHIVSEMMCCAGIIPTQWPFVRSVQSLNGERLRISRERRPVIQNAGITKCDMMATNGIIHQINDVILVPKRTQQTVLQRPIPPQFSHFDDFIF